MLIGVSLDYVHGRIILARRDPVRVTQYGGANFERLESLRIRLLMLGYVYVPNPHGNEVALVCPEFMEK